MAISKKNEKGILIMELLVVISIVTLALVYLLGSAVLSLKIQGSLKKDLQANVLAQELIEAARNFREGTSWNVNGLGTLLVNRDYYAQKTTDNPPKWTMVLGEETVGIFTRKMVFQEVRRDANGNIVEGSGSVDSDTKKIRTIVTWPGAPASLEIHTYLTNWK